MNPLMEDSAEVIAEKAEIADSKHLKMISIVSAVKVGDKYCNNVLMF